MGSDGCGGVEAAGHTIGLGFSTMRTCTVARSPPSACTVICHVPSRADMPASAIRRGLPFMRYIENSVSYLLNVRFSASVECASPPESSTEYSSVTPLRSNGSPYWSNPYILIAVLSRVITSA